MRGGSAFLIQHEERSACTQWISEERVTEISRGLEELAESAEALLADPRLAPVH